MQINKIYMAQWRTSSYLYLDCDFGLVTNTSFSVVQEKYKWQNYYLKQKRPISTLMDWLMNSFDVKKVVVHHKLNWPISLVWNIFRVKFEIFSECARDGGEGRRPRQYNRHDYPATKHRTEKYNKNADIYFGKSDNHLHRERGRKTPFEIFLEDDGPYSRHVGRFCLKSKFNEMNFSGSFTVQSREKPSQNRLRKSAEGIRVSQLSPLQSQRSTSTVRLENVWGNIRKISMKIF